MSAPTLTRLGVLRTHAFGYYDAGEQAAGVMLATIDGVEIRRDDGSPSPALYPGFVYDVMPNDGWAVDPTTPAVQHDEPHWAHLVDAEGRVATVLPLKDGAVSLDRTHRYVVRQDGWHAEWVLYQAS